MTSKKMPKNAKKYYCEKCDFICSKLSNYNIHLSTPKHQILTNTYIKDAENAKAYICDCGKEYKHRQSLNNHKKKCNYTEVVEETSKITKTSEDDISVKDVMVMMMEQSKQFTEVLKEVKNTNTITNNNTTNNNTQNNNFNLNFFLNEQCKNAMNITDFVKSIEIGVEDVANVGKLGYVEGITRIVTKALNNLDVYERPIHCSDLKREVMYVKDNGIWEKENETKPNMKKALEVISHKNVMKIKAWTDANPSWKKHYSKEEDEYLKISYESMGGSNAEEYDKYFSKIIRKVANNVTIDKVKNI